MSSTNPESCNTFPLWLNQDYIEDAIRFKFEDNSITILKYEAVPATSKGDNYASVMIRIRVEYMSNTCNEPRKASYILKTSFQQLPNPLPNDALVSCGVYRREMLMYEAIFPQFKDILLTIGYSEDLVADAIKIDHLREGMLLEDLKDRHYVMLQRKTGLNLEHAKLILRKLAKFHAASVILNEMEPSVFSEFDRGAFNKHTNSLAQFYIGCMEECTRAVCSWKGFGAIGAKLSKIRDKVMEYGTGAFEAKDDRLNVLIHGDLWTNNVMFKYDSDGEVIDAILLDFQFSCWASSTLDLHYFFHTSLTEDVRDNHLDDLVQYFYANLVDTLRELDYVGSTPSPQKFWAEYMETSVYAVITACVEQSIILFDRPVDDDDCNIFGNDEEAKNFRKIVYSDANVERNLKKLLPIFDQQGLLDVK